MSTCKYTESVEKWGTFEAEMPGKHEGNPFTDYAIQGTFKGKEETKTIDGFYDGDGIYRVRFMPSFEGDYTFEIKGSFSDEVYTGAFHVTPATEGNHGPVRVSYTYHMAYEDGKPYYSIGTTCYVWELQSEELQKQTLETLADSAFNKIRFCVFPKHYDYNLNEPISYPYEGTPMDSSVLTSENFQEYVGCAEGDIEMNQKILEVCVDSVESALAAERGGADRLELCQNLVIGGTTPSPKLFETIRRYSKIPIHVLLRPRFGDFCYTQYEFEMLREEVTMYRKLGAEGVVIGMLLPEGTLDIRRMEKLIRT